MLVYLDFNFFFRIISTAVRDYHPILYNMYQSMRTYFFKGCDSIDPIVVSERLAVANYSVQIKNVNNEKNFLHVDINEDNIERIVNLFNDIPLNIEYAIDKYAEEQLLLAGSNFLEKLASYKGELSSGFIQLWIQLLDRGKNLGARMLPSPQVTYSSIPDSHGRMAHGRMAHGRMARWTHQTRTPRQHIARYLNESKITVNELQNSI